MAWRSLGDASLMVCPPAAPLANIARVSLVLVLPSTLIAFWFSVSAYFVSPSLLHTTYERALGGVDEEILKLSSRDRSIGADDPKESGHVGMYHSGTFSHAG